MIEQYKGGYHKGFNDGIKIGESDSVKISELEKVFELLIELSERPTRNPDFDYAYSAGINDAIKNIKGKIGDVVNEQKN